MRLHLFDTVISMHGYEQCKDEKASGRFSQFCKRTQKVMALPHVIMPYIIYVSAPMVWYEARHDLRPVSSNK
jgi:hypothetical protein